MSDENISTIPFDVIESEILSRLDPKTLVQCTSVCKLWNSLIKSPAFIISHHSCHSNNTTNESLLFQICSQENDRVYKGVFHDQEVYSLLFDINHPLFHVPRLRALKSPPFHRFKNRNTFFKLLGSCNGLVCLADHLFHPYTMILWNPTLQKYVLLPTLDDTVRSVEDQPCLAFSFDSRNNDFKVVKLVCKRNRLHWAWVCSFGTRSWKLIKADNDHISPPCVVYGKDYVFVNDVLHWLARHNKTNYDFVLSFDVAEEVFGEILLPERVTEERLRSSWASVSLFKRKDSLAVSLHEEPGRRGCGWFVWVMKEYGVVESWTMVVTVRNTELIPKNVLFFSENGEMIVEMIGNRIVRYNPTTATMENIFVVKSDRRDCVSICNHKESLFLLHEGQRVMSYNY